MAHFDKVSAGWKQVLNHDYRKQTDKRENIDKSLSYLNYDLIDRNDPWKFVEDKIEESKKSGGRFQDGTVILCECVITVPIDFIGDERLFFEECKRVLDKHFGSDNCVSAIVHRDEPGARSHLHYKAVPIVEKEKTYKDGRKKQIKQFSAKELLNQSYLSYFHDQLQEELEATFRHDVNVKTNGSTKEQRQEIVELKEQIEEQKILIRQQKEEIRDLKEQTIKQSRFIQAAKSLMINGQSIFQMILEHMRRKDIKKKEIKISHEEKDICDDILR